MPVNSPIMAWVASLAIVFAACLLLWVAINPRLPRRLLGVVALVVGLISLVSVFSPDPVGSGILALTTGVLGLAAGFRKE
ncbi:hypothetical protein [Bifidobacterium favimelis]|uniref:DUF2484 family protein n=1 Tax=Bifidobacterium favimelis TaxID=3122979 RepID=A0ABU8ZNY2_9BIFI